jgi:hypothetical protein
MSVFVEWIAAEADEESESVGGLRNIKPHADQQAARRSSSLSDLWQKLPVHNFPAGAPLGEVRQDDALERNPDLWLYRSRTIALLRRYERFSLETGRLPSLVGREFFRTKVTSYHATTFEDRVIFVHDVEMCLHRLEHWDQELIARVILQEHNQGDAARILQCCRKTIQRRLSQVLDLLSEDFLKVGLLVALPSTDEASR